MFHALWVSTVRGGLCRAGRARCLCWGYGAATRRDTLASLDKPPVNAAAKAPSLSRPPPPHPLPPPAAAAAAAATVAAARGNVSTWTSARTTLTDLPGSVKPHAAPPVVPRARTFPEPSDAPASLASGMTKGVTSSDMPRVARAPRGHGKVTRGTMHATSARRYDKVKLWFKQLIIRVGGGCNWYLDFLSALVYLFIPKYEQLFW